VCQKQVCIRTSRKETKITIKMKKGLSKFDIYAIAIGTAGIGYFVYRQIQKNKENKGEKKDVKKVEDDITTLSKKGQKPSYTEGSYGIFASQILQACAGYGTDEEQIYRVMEKMKKDIDFAKLVSAFGRRTMPCDKLMRPFDNCGDGNLMEILSSELDDSEASKCNNILAKNGVTYRI
jgi:hypothetical protein